MAKRGDEKLFIDTNILIYLTNYQSDLIGQISQDVWKLWEQYQFCISGQVFREYLCVATREARNDYKDVLVDYFIYEEQFEVLDENRESRMLFKRIINNKKIHPRGKQVHDANIVATMLAHGVTKLYTHNVSDFKRYLPLIQILEVGKI